MPDLDENSRRTRVRPIFTWLKEQAGEDWPARFIRLVDDLEVRIDPGRLVAGGLYFEPEHRVAPSPRRLAWLIRNAERLTPRDGRNWSQYGPRILKNPR